MTDSITLQTMCNVPVEITLSAASVPQALPHTLVVNVLFTDPAGVTRRVPAFWAGGLTWQARYSSGVVGTHSWRSECVGHPVDGLHGIEGAVEVAPYDGGNPLYLHGPIQVSEDKRRFEHADHTPFFWLGDTWWMGLCTRLQWPDEFERLTADRVAKGFNVVQIVAGLYPDMPPLDPRGANEAGFPWTPEYGHIRPEYFDLVDRRLQYLIDAGITPCIVGMWGYFLPWIGAEKAKEHWRYLIARYASWPVVWCVAGEANLPYYLTEGFPFDDRGQVTGWTDVMRYVRETDPFHRPLSIHPTGLGRLTARGATDDESLLDFDMLQTGHGEKASLAPTVDTLIASYDAQPRMPVFNSEVNYEALMDRIPAEVVRLMFWPSILSGAAGHTYGANGIWQCNRRDEAHGASPGGGNWGVLPWDDAMILPGSGQLGAAKRFLLRYAWAEIDPCPDGASWQERDEDVDAFVPYAADLGSGVRMVYVPADRPVHVHLLGPGKAYRTTLFDPVKDVREELGETSADSAGEMILAPPEHGHDWVVVLEAVN